MTLSFFCLFCVFNLNEREIEKAFDDDYNNFHITHQHH